MYTYNLFCFGINPEKLDKEFIDNLDFQFTSSNGYSIESHYHGNKGYCYVIGLNIIDDDNNPNYVKTVKNSKQEDFIDGYNIFKSEVLSLLEESISEAETVKEEHKNSTEVLDEINSIIDMFKDLKNVMINTAPEFYSVEVSS